MSNRCSGRDGREQHHFEMFICRENKLRVAKERGNLIKGFSLGVLWLIIALISWVVS